MSLCSTNDNNGLTSDDVYASGMGTTDTVSGVSQLATWRISYAFGGYIFENNVTDACLRIVYSSTPSDASVICHFFAMSNSSLWELSKISSPPAGAYLYDSSNESIVSTAMVYIDVGTTKTLSQLGLSAVAYSGTNISQSFTWSSSDTSVATVSSNGVVTGVSAGESTITGCVYRNNTYYYVSYKINVSRLLIYQTLSTYNNDSNGNLAEDLIYGDMSAEVLGNLDWLNWNDIAEYTPEQHRAEWEDTCTDFSTGELEDVVLDMVDHFMDGSGTPYSNIVLTKKILEHDSTQAYVEFVEEQIQTILNTNEGDIGELAYTVADNYSHPLVVAFYVNEIDQPNYDTLYDRLNGLTICVHYLWGNKIEITSYNISGSNYTYTMHYTLYDHFGLNAEDVMSFNWGEGFHSWYVLQHYSEYNSAYKPFLTLIEFDITVSGTIS